MKTLSRAKILRAYPYECPYCRCRFKRGRQYAHHLQAQEKASVRGLVNLRDAIRLAIGAGLEIAPGKEGSRG